MHSCADAICEFSALRVRASTGYPIQGGSGAKASRGRFGAGQCVSREVIETARIC